ncbi:GYF domain-containing protein [Haloferula sp.]|uniref:GYF domain-containing protein n=1 Tax=Haloferula sp. TaxID=2497595 RepID=UPI00329FAB14
MSEGKDEWYVSRSGQRFGPVTYAELEDSAKAGRLEPRTDMVIGGDLTEWKPAGDVAGLYEKASPTENDELEGDPTGHTPPKGSLADSGSFDFNKGEGQTLKLPGAPRLGYFLGVTVLPTLIIVGLGKVMPQIQGVIGKDYGGWAEFLIFLAPLVVVIITVKRFQNLAMTGWWWFGLLVPFLNLWLYYRLFACPAGYAYTKKLDVIGKVLAVIYWLTPVALIVAGIIFAGALKKMEEDGKLQEILNKIEELTPEVPDLPKKSNEEPSEESSSSRGPQF